MRPWLLSVAIACTVDEGRLPPAPPAPTWVEVGPILSRCATCHDGTGVAFPITRYEEAAALAPILASVVGSRQMPPWRASDAADVTYADDPSLTDDEIATVTAWADAGAPLGDADPSEPLVGPSPDLLPRIDAELVMAEPYLPVVSPDDHRCFVLDRGDLGDVWVTGVEVLPSNLAAAHHLTVLAVTATDPENTPATADAAEPGPGWDCSETVATSFPGDIQQLGGWLPGRGAVLYPEGSGVFLPKDATVILKAHYFTPTAGDVPDLTRVRLSTASEVSLRASELKVNNPDWQRQRGIAVPAGETVEHRMVAGVRAESKQMADIDPEDGLRVHWVLLHMHELGVSTRLEVLRGEERFVLLDIPQWDFDWQLEYWLADPFVLEPDDELRVSCVHTNPTDTDVWWGERTSEEMCVARMFVSEVED